MACCALGLLLVCQMFETWRRVRVWLGMPARAAARAGVMAENLRTRMIAVMRRPWFRAGAVLVLTAELAFAGNLFYEHRVHLREAKAELVVLLRDGPQNIADICRSRLGLSSEYGPLASN
jgi:hypothetical protein